MAPISGAGVGDPERQKKQNGGGQSWNPNYSIITPKSGRDSIYPVPAFSSSSSAFQHLFVQERTNK